ncbi:MAG: SDR family oxidoreductase [Armatimonadetes bacterium]|jgi:NAD(P)-dependent dehydrogenase (short-subunit alcohol dehydrogenase family)|nr:SDR family oxidoreductase [Armatimonadota bacterium]MDI9583370.1 SDR family oxidoreductase [Acidobacteriota bacterium]
MRFEGRVAVISGAASGMGLLTGQRLAAEGARVVLTDVNESAVQAAAQGICDSGGEAIGLQVDVRCYDQVKSSVETAVERYGSVDILMNSAGGASSRVHGRSEPFHEIPIEIVDWGLDVNLKGAVYFCHAVLGHMIRQKRGVIINMGSVDGVTGSMCLDYGAAKSAMIGLTKSITLYGSPHGVRSCCVSPGPVLTRPEMANMKTRLGRAAEPREIVTLILYLCSDDAAFITGANYVIDGGRSVGGMG